MSILPLPKLYHPDFSSPRVKPTGPVEVDYSSAFSQKLKLIDVQQGYNFDLIGKRARVNTDNLTWKAGGVSGLYLDFAGSPEHVDYGFAPSGFTDFTLIQLIRPAGAVNSFSVSSRSTSGAQGVEILIGAGSNPLLMAGRAAGSTTDVQTAGVAIDDENLWHTFIYTRKGEVHSNVAIDETGRVFTDSATETAIGTITSSQNLSVGKRGSTFYTGDAGFFVFSEAGYSLESAIHLAHNVYSELLKPAIPQLYIVPDVAPPAGFEPQFAANSNVLIQGCAM